MKNDSDPRFALDKRYLREQAGAAFTMFVAPLTAAYLAAFSAGKQARRTSVAGD
jgi:hypothetical protein